MRAFTCRPAAYPMLPTLCKKVTPARDYRPVIALALLMGDAAPIGKWLNRRGDRCRSVKGEQTWTLAASISRLRRHANVAHVMGGMGDMVVVAKLDLAGLRRRGLRAPAGIRKGRVGALPERKAARSATRPSPPHAAWT